MSAIVELLNARSAVRTAITRLEKTPGLRGPLRDALLLRLAAQRREEAWLTDLLNQVRAETEVRS